MSKIIKKGSKVTIIAQGKSGALLISTATIDYSGQRNIRFKNNRKNYISDLVQSSIEDLNAQPNFDVVIAPDENFILELASIKEAQRKDNLERLKEELKDHPTSTRIKNRIKENSIKIQVKDLRT